jgi:protein-serine/threonine kinase
MICNAENHLGRNGPMGIKTHPFFPGVDFSALRRIRTPFEPPLTSEIDTSCFPVDDLPQTEDSIPSPAGADEPPIPGMVLSFVGNTFKRFEKSYI